MEVLLPYLVIISVYCAKLQAVEPSVDSDYSPYLTENITKLTNETIDLICPESTDIEWRRLNFGSMVFEKLPWKSDILEIKNLTLLDNGTYACYTQNRLLKAYNLTVYEPPYFVRKMQKLIVKPAGNMVVLKCKAQGYPIPNITWTKDDKPPKRELGGIKYNHWSLNLEDVVTNDIGNYTCNVCNIAGCVNFTYVVDVVERYPHKPYIKDGHPENQTIVENRTVTFKCPLLIADLEPYIQWIKVTINDTKVLDDMDVRNNIQKNLSLLGTVLQV